MRPRPAVDRALRSVGLVLASVFALEAVWIESGRRPPGLAALAVGYALAVFLTLARRLVRPAALAPSHGPGTSAALLLLPVAVAVWLYAPALASWYIADDFAFVVQLPRMSFAETRVWWWPTGAQDWQFLRPLSHSLTWVLARSSGPDPVLLHAINAGLHAAAAGLLGWVVASLVGRAAAGLYAGIAFAIAPLAVSSVAWIDTHQDPLVVFFSVASLAALVRALRGRRSATPSALLFGLGLLSKEPAISLPAAAVVVVWAYDPEARGARALLRRLSPHLLVSLLYLGWRLVLFGGPGGYVTGQQSPFAELRAGTLAGILRELPATLLLPANQAIVPGAEALRAAAAALAMLGLALALRAEDARSVLLALVGLAWLGASIVPVHNMLWMGPELLNARYLYVAAMASVLIMTGLVFAPLAPGPPRSRLPPLAAGMVAAATLAAWLGLALANRSQWFAIASIPAGIADDLRAMDRIAPLARVEFEGFPPFFGGSYLFHLELLPTAALGRDVEAVSRRSDGVLARFGPERPGASISYRWLGGDRLWRRDSWQGVARP